MSFQPSPYSFAGPGTGLFVLSNPKLSRDACDKADADRKKYLKKMWDAKIFTKKRVTYEKKAAAAHKLSVKCKKEGVGGREKGYPNLSISKLWQSDPKTRPQEAGLIVATFLTGPEIQDIITAAIKGWNPLFVIALEWRAEIAGGLLALQAAGVEGYETVDAGALEKLVAITLSKKDNAKLLQMAGEKGDDDAALRSAAKRMRAKVAELGEGAMSYAFGMRGLNMIKASTIAVASADVAKLGISLIPVVGWIIGAVKGVQKGISQVLMENAKKRMEALVTQGSEIMAADAEIKAAKAELEIQKKIEAVEKEQLSAIEAASKKNTTTTLHAPPPVAAASSNTFLWAGVAAIAILGVVTVVRTRGN